MRTHDVQSRARIHELSVRSAELVPSPCSAHTPHKRRAMRTRQYFGTHVIGMPMSCGPAYADWYEPASAARGAPNEMAIGRRPLAAPPVRASMRLRIVQVGGQVRGLVLLWSPKGSVIAFRSPHGALCGCKCVAADVGRVGRFAGWRGMVLQGGDWNRCRSRPLPAPVPVLRWPQIAVGEPPFPARSPARLGWPRRRRWRGLGSVRARFRRCGSGSR